MRQGTARVEINLDYLAHNISEVNRLIDPKTKIMVVVKSGIINNEDSH